MVNKRGITYILMMVWSCIFSMLIVMAHAMVVFAQEAAATVSKRGSWTDFFYSEAFLGVIALIVVKIWTAVKKTERMQILKDERYAKGLEFLEQGVKEVWDERKEHIKKAKADGKFTAEEKKACEKAAVDKAVAYAKEEGWDLLENVSKAIIPVIIEKIVKSRKAPKVSSPS